ncbi:hypothetical protein CHS0354_023716 [Potamilus streckersoni]|uniref:Tetratricopeptide repeat protein n=1 Tax=Potamilus streckersoni TaxID=2493646 RepID=A0AAE0VMI5_9BIVA|nr:hypothetical protein CHS0354_023716 [Potamilus streckersoni]
MQVAANNLGYVWYAEAPVGFIIKKESRKRLLVLTIIVILILGIFVGVYLYVKLNQPIIKVPERVKVEVNINAIPPPPTEARKQEKVAATQSDQALSRSEASATSAAAESELTSALEEATSSLLSDLAVGLPAATGSVGGSGLEGLVGGSIVDGSGLGGGLGSGGSLGAVDLSSLNAIGAPGVRGGIGGPGKIQGGGGIGQANLGIKKTGNLVVGVQSRDLKVGSGGRSADEIGIVVSKSRVAIQKCYEEARAIDGNFEGSIYMVVSILPNGNVKEVQVGKMSFKSDILEMQRFIRWRSLPFVFAHSFVRAPVFLLIFMIVLPHDAKRFTKSITVESIELSAPFLLSGYVEIEFTDGNTLNSISDIGSKRVSFIGESADGTSIVSSIFSMTTVIDSTVSKSTTVTVEPGLDTLGGNKNEKDPKKQVMPGTASVGSSINDTTKLLMTQSKDSVIINQKLLIGSSKVDSTKENVSMVGIDSVSKKSLAEDTLDEFGVSIFEVKRRMKKIERDEALYLSRLYPINFMRVPTGDFNTDSVFTHYSPQQVDISLDGSLRRIQYLKLQRDKASNTAINIIKSFFSDFPDSKTVDDILIRYMELLYENFTESFELDKKLYEKRLEIYEKSAEYVEYKNALKEYYKSEASLSDTLEVYKPVPPTPPEPPDPKLDLLLEIYDQILSNVQDEKYIPHVLFAKAYVLGERYVDYKIMKNLKDIDIDQKRQEAISFLEQLLRKYPDNDYTVQTYILIGEYLFNSTRKQPRRTIEAIPYYQRAVQYIVERNASKEYYQSVLYKLAWSYFRIDEYKEARTWFNYLMEDIEKNEEIYSGKSMPSYILTGVKYEVISNLAECFLKIQRKEDDTRSAAEEISSIYRTSVKFQIRRFTPLIYQRLGELYEESAEFEKVKDVYTVLLRKFPNYELAPYITNKIIRLLEIMAQNGEFDGVEQEIIEQQLYEERKNLFYRYGRTTKWYENMRLRIEAQSKGITLPFEERSVSPSGFNPLVLRVADSLGRDALFRNIVDGVTKGQLLDGTIKPMLGKEVVVNKEKAAGFYRQSVSDIDNYLQVYSSNDSSSYFVAFQKAQILQFKLNKPLEAFRSYIRLAKNFSHDSLKKELDDPDSPLKSYRRESLDLAFTIADEIAKNEKVGFYTPGLDTVSRIPKSPSAIKKDELYMLEVLELYVRLFPNDTIGYKSAGLLMKFYAVKGYMEKYREYASILNMYYPVQNVDLGILAMIAAREYDDGRFQNAELIAKGIHKAPFLKDEKKDPKQLEFRKYAFNLIGTSIASKAKKLEDEKKYLEAAKEYQRIVYEVPEWSQSALAAQYSANNYANAGLTRDAVGMNRKLIDLSKDSKQKLIGYSGLLYAFQKAGELDSVSLVLEKISDEYQKDSLNLAERSLFDAIRISEQSSNFKQAIRLSNKYIDRYPDLEKTYKVVFNKINLSKKLGDLLGVFEAYGQFADTYSDNPLSVEAYFRRGDFAEEKGDFEIAREEYMKAYDRNLKLLKEKKNNLFANESLYRLSRKFILDYKSSSVGLSVPDEVFESQIEKKKKPKSEETNANSFSSSNIGFDAKQKESLYKEVKENLLKQINLGGFRSIIAQYRVAEISEDLAHNYLSQIPLLETYKNSKGEAIPPIKLAEGVTKANIESAVMFTRSGEDYISVWTSLKRQLQEVISKIEIEKIEKSNAIVDLKFSEKLYGGLIELSTKISKNSETFISDIEQFEKLAVEWVMTTSTPVPLDIIKNLIESVAETCRKRAVHSLYQTAMLKEKNADFYSKLEVPDDVKNFTINVGKGKGKISVFMGDVQELIVLSKLVSTRVRPFSQQAVIAYDSLVRKIQKLNVSQEEIVAIENKIQKLLLLPVERVDSLVRIATRYFDIFDVAYDDRLSKVDAANKQTKNDVIDFVINKVKMNQIIQVINGLTTSALDEYASAYKTFKSLESDDVKLNSVANKAAKFVYDIGSLYLSTYQRLKEKFKKYNDLANQYFDKDWLSAAAVSYEPIQNLFLSLSQNVLGQAVILISEYKIQNEYTSKSLNLLVESDRAKYLSYLGTEAVKDNSFQGNWSFSLNVPEEDYFEWYKKDYPKANSWREAFQNEEVVVLKYLHQVNDTSYTLKPYNANSYWFRKYSSSVDVVVAEEGRDALSLKSASLNPFKNDGDQYEVTFEFDKKNKLKGSNNESVINTIYSFVSESKEFLIEVRPYIFDLNLKKGKKRTEVFKTRATSIINELVKKGIDKKRFLIFDVKKLEDTQTKTILRAIKSPATTKDDESNRKIPYKQDTGSINEIIYRSTYDLENYGFLQDSKGVPEYAYFRSSFEFKDAVKFAQLIMSRKTKLDSMELYVNDVFVDMDKERIVTTKGMSYHYDESKQLIYDITAKIVNGTNLIALKVPTRMTQQGINLFSNIAYYGAVTPEQLQKLVTVVIENRAKSMKQLKEASSTEAQAPSVPED